MKPLDFGGEDMFVILTYDVHRKRCAKVMKYLRLWLEHRQRSVFSGYLSTSQIRIMEQGLRKLIDVQYDSVIIFQTNRADQITETCTRAAEQARITSMIVMPEHQRRKIAHKAATKKRIEGGVAVKQRPVIKDPAQWKFRF